MFNEKILDYLKKYTEEEVEILSGKSVVDKKRYTENTDFIVDAKKLLHDDELINVRKHTRFIDFPKHKHNFIEITYVYQGEMTQIINGKKVVLKSGEIIFLNQYIVHEIRASGQDDIIINFIIKPEFFNYILDFLDKDNIISKFLISTIYGGTKKGEYLCFHAGDSKNTQNILEEVITEIFNLSILGKAKVKFLIGLLIIELLSKPEKIRSYSEENYDMKLMIEILQYINTEYVTANLKELSKKIRQPDYKICKVLKENTGMTFTKLVQEKRLEKFVELLKSTDFAIEDLIKKIGYENTSYFYKIFKNKYKLSPKEVKKGFGN